MQYRVGEKVAFRALHSPRIASKSDCANGVYPAMLFTETAVFTKRAKELLDDETYRLLQVRLLISPNAGDVIEGTGGLRKIRAPANGHGKRGGARVIYYHFTARSHITLLYIFAKNEQTELSAEQRKALKSVIENWRYP